MKLHKLTKKQLAISAISFAAASGIVLSVFADTAGGIATMHNNNAAAHQPVAAHKAIGEAAGDDAINTGFRTATLAAAFVQPSSESPSSSSVNGGEPVPAGQPTAPPSGDSNDNSGDHKVPNPAPTPEPPCAQCPTPKFRGEGTMVACDYCVQPTPGCQPCGGFREAQTSDAIACPMVMCAY